MNWREWVQQYIESLQRLSDEGRKLRERLQEIEDECECQIAQKTCQ